MKTRKKCRCGATAFLIQGGGEYFKKLAKPVWACSSKFCFVKRKKPKLTFK